MGTQYTNTHRGSMHWNTRCIYGDMMYAQRESTSLRQMSMNPCKWRQDAYSEGHAIEWTNSEDHAIEWTNPMGVCTKGSVRLPCGQVVYICVLLNLVSEQQSCEAWQKEDEKVMSALLHD